MSDALHELIARVLDYPSSYMGGASHHSLMRAKRITDALAASGYAVVPVKATEEMVLAALDRHQQEDEVMHSSIWRAMLAAAQKEQR